MKLFRSALLIMGETAAFGWFILQDISFLAVLPLIPLGVLFYYLYRLGSDGPKWLNGICAGISLVIVAVTISRGVFDGYGLFMLLCLIPAVALLAVSAPKKELERISGWWMTAFLIIFIAMLIATLPGIRLREGLPSLGRWSDILIFYLLAFLEPMSLGKDYRAAPLALGILLMPFSLAAYLALGQGAFAMAEHPYLSVWAGVAVSAFHHTEGIILCFYCGAGALRLAHFGAEFGKTRCNDRKFIV